MENEIDPNHIVDIKTVQSSAFRVLIEALKEILQDVNIIFDDTGFKIVAMDVSHTVLVHLKLESKNFEHYFCGKKCILGINMKHCAYRPLKGNGLNRDTSVYVGVQTLENSGVDRRVDLILTEGGMEWGMAESHAIWT